MIAKVRKVFGKKGTMKLKLNDQTATTKSPSNDAENNGVVNESVSNIDNQTVESRISKISHSVESSLSSSNSSSYHSATAASPDENIAIKEMLEGRVNLTIQIKHLNEQIIFTVDRTMPLYDILVTISNRFHFNPSNYTIVADDGLKSKQMLKLKSLCVGLIGTDKISIVPKPVNSLRKDFAQPKGLPFQPTVRFQINLPGKQLMVKRILLSTPFHEIKTIICDERPIDPAKYLLVKPFKPGQTPEIVDLDKSPEYYGINEVTVLSKRNYDELCRQFTSNSRYIYIDDSESNKLNVQNDWSQSTPNISVKISSETCSIASSRASRSYKKKPAPPPPNLLNGTKSVQNLSIIHDSINELNEDDQCSNITAPSTPSGIYSSYELKSKSANNEQISKHQTLQQNAQNLPRTRLTRQNSGSDSSGYHEMISHTPTDTPTDSNSPAPPLSPNSAPYLDGISEISKSDVKLVKKEPIAAERQCKTLNEPSTFLKCSSSFKNGQKKRRAPLPPSNFLPKSVKTNTSLDSFNQRVESPLTETSEESPQSLCSDVSFVTGSVTDESANSLTKSINNLENDNLNSIYVPPIDGSTESIEQNKIINDELEISATQEIILEKELNSNLIVNKMEIASKSLSSVDDQPANPICEIELSDREPGSVMSDIITDKSEFLNCKPVENIAANITETDDNDSSNKTMVDYYEQIDRKKLFWLSMLNDTYDYEKLNSEIYSLALSSDHSLQQEHRLKIEEYPNLIDNQLTGNKYNEERKLSIDTENTISNKNEHQLLEKKETKNITADSIIAAPINENIDIDQHRSSFTTKNNLINVNFIDAENRSDINNEISLNVQEKLNDIKVSNDEMTNMNVNSDKNNNNSKKNNNTGAIVTITDWQRRGTNENNSGTSSLFSSNIAGHERRSVNNGNLEQKSIEKQVEITLNELNEALDQCDLSTTSDIDLATVVKNDETITKDQSQHLKHVESTDSTISTITTKSNTISSIIVPGPIENTSTAQMTIGSMKNDQNDENQRLSSNSFSVRDGIRKFNVFQCESSSQRNINGLSCPVRRSKSRQNFTNGENKETAPKVTRKLTNFQIGSFKSESSINIYEDVEKFSSSSSTSNNGHEQKQLNAKSTFVIVDKPNNNKSSRNANEEHQNVTIEHAKQLLSTVNQANGMDKQQPAMSISSTSTKTISVTINNQRQSNVPTGSISLNNDDFKLNNGYHDHKNKNKIGIKTNENFFSNKNSNQPNAQSFIQELKSRTWSHRNGGNNGLKFRQYEDEINNVSLRNTQDHNLNNSNIELNNKKPQIIPPPPPPPPPTLTISNQNNLPNSQNLLAPKGWKPQLSQNIGSQIIRSPLRSISMDPTHTNSSTASISSSVFSREALLNEIKNFHCNSKLKKVITSKPFELKMN